MIVVNGKPADLASFKVTGPNAKAIQLETIKRGEDDEEGIKTIILRMYESFGGRAQGAIGM
jgi:alpha-mannosidase